MMADLVGEWWVVLVVVFLGRYPVLGLIWSACCIEMWSGFWVVRRGVVE